MWVTKLLPTKKITLPNGKTVIEKSSLTPLYVLLILGFSYLSMMITGFDLEILIKRIGQFFVILKEMIPPTWEYFPHIWQPLLDTIKMSLLGSLLGAVTALPLAMLAASNITKRVNRFRP